MTILAGDIGGTNTRLALFEEGPRRPVAVVEHSYRSADYPSLEAVVTAFLEETGESPEGAAFGLAGPVAGRTCRTTNLPWLVDADRMQERTGIPWVHLLNDLEAFAWGISALPEDALLTLHPGEPNAQGNRAVIAAGTGLGQAGMFWDGRAHRPFATEGGHTDFAPNNDLEFRLLRFLSKDYGHVSWERVVSGPGLLNIHRFLLSHRGTTPPEWLKEAMGQGDPSAAIAQAASAGRDEICLEAMTLFVHLYGVEAGNLALKHMAKGGLYIGGGIAPKILPWLQRGIFLESLFDKGRMSLLLQTMPVRVILDDRAGLLGPAVFLQARS
jgi:glucokinase